LRFFFCR